MAHRKQQTERVQQASQAMLVWALSEIDEFSLFEFIRCGQWPGGPAQKALPDNPLVDAKIAEIMANGGRLIVPVESGNGGSQ